MIPLILSIMTGLSLLVFIIYTIQTFELNK